MYLPYSGILSGGRVPIQPLRGMDPPNSFFNEKQECERRIYEIQDVSKIGFQAVRQDAYQLQQFNQRLYANVVMHEEAQLAKLAIFAVRLCKEKYKTPRMITYMGNLSVPQVEYIDGDKIDFKTCVIEPGSSMQSAKWQDLQSTLLAWDKQLIEPTPANRRRVLRKIMDTDLLPDSLDSMNEQNAQAENFAFKMMVVGTKGEDTGAYYTFDRAAAENSISAFVRSQSDQTGQTPFDTEVLGADGFVLPDNDDHEIHYATHNSFIISSEVRNLPKAHRDQLIDIINIHNELHDIAMQLGLGFSEEQQMLKKAMQAKVLQGQAGAGAPQQQSPMGQMLGLGGKPHRANPGSGTPGEFSPAESQPAMDFPLPSGGA